VTRSLSRTGALRSRVEAVDVFVTDADGHPVSGLRADDSELAEDGKRQDITTFQAVDIPTDVRASGSDDVTSREIPIRVR
jgi:hypothetical protein